MLREKANGHNMNAFRGSLCQGSLQTYGSFYGLMQTYGASKQGKFLMVIFYGTFYSLMQGLAYPILTS